MHHSLSRIHINTGLVRCLKGMDKVLTIVKNEGTCGTFD